MLNTIGYQGANASDLVSTLKHAGVTCLVDIRERAQSRKTGFSKSSLSKSLQAVGIQYFHFRELGDPREGRLAAQAGDYLRFIDIYAGVLKSPEAKNALKAIENIMAGQTICLLCYERESSGCHRKIVAEELESRSGRVIRHLGVQTSVPPAAQGRRMRDLGQGSAAPYQ